MKLEDLVRNYIALRDRKATLKTEYETKVAVIDDVMGKVEAHLLNVFNEMGMDSVKTEFGTAYKATRTSASVADWDAFFSYVKLNDAWELLEHRCSKVAVEQFKAANADLPPGVNWREEQIVNIRRSA